MLIVFLIHDPMKNEGLLYLVHIEIECLDMFFQFSASLRVYEKSREIAREITKGDVYRDQSRAERKKVEMLFAHMGTKLKAINTVMEFTTTHNNIERLKIKKSAN